MSQRLENVFYRNIPHRASSKHIVTVDANGHRLPNLLLQRREMTYTMRLIDDDVTLTASTGTGQTGLPLAEVEEETDLFLKTVTTSLWGLLFVIDNGAMQVLY